MVGWKSLSSRKVNSPNKRKIYTVPSQTVLAAWEAEPRVGRDFEKESPVVGGVRKLFPGWATQRDATKRERPGIEGEFLFAGLSSLAD